MGLTLNDPEINSLMLFWLSQLSALRLCVINVFISIFRVQGFFPLANNNNSAVRNLACSSRNFLCIIDIFKNNAILRNNHPWISESLLLPQPSPTQIEVHRPSFTLIFPYTLHICHSLACLTVTVTLDYSKCVEPELDGL